MPAPSSYTINFLYCETCGDPFQYVRSNGQYGALMKCPCCGKEVVMHIDEGVTSVPRALLDGKNVKKKLYNHQK